MTSDKNKTKDELVRELKALRKRLEEHTNSYEKECKLHGRAEEELRLAKVIIDNSPVVLFRLMAGEKAGGVEEKPGGTKSRENQRTSRSIGRSPLPRARSSWRSTA